MRALFALVVAAALLTCQPALAVTVPPTWAGTWQGTLPALRPQGVPIVIQISRLSGTGWKATMLIDDANPVPVTSVNVAGSSIELLASARRFQGVLSADGNSIKGTWIRGNPRVLDDPYPLELRRATRQTTWSLLPDGSTHTTQYITVDKDVNLEVLDWGGTGRAVVLLTGLGDNAHVFDPFATKLTAQYHVYGITRRGFGNSSTPYTGYSADRLGDDVIAVLDALHLDHPVLVGHSIAGEELSSVGSRYPKRVAGLIYLDAGYPYAYYERLDTANLDTKIGIDLPQLQRRLDQLKPSNPVAPTDPAALIRELLDTELPWITQDLQARLRDLEAMPPGPQVVPSVAPGPRRPQVADDILEGAQRYTSIPVPILAIFAMPHNIPAWVAKDPATQAAAEARDEATNGAQVSAFEKGVPSARVVRLPHADHYVFRSNEVQVLREMNTFIGDLPP